MYKAGHAFTYLLRRRRPAAQASDLRVVRTGPVCGEPRTPSTSGGVVCGPVSTLKADILNITYDRYSQNNTIKMATL